MIILPFLLTAAWRPASALRRRTFNDKPRRDSAPRLRSAGAGRSSGNRSTSAESETTDWRWPTREEHHGGTQRVMSRSRRLSLAMRASTAGAAFAHGQVIRTRERLLRERLQHTAGRDALHPLHRQPIAPVLGHFASCERSAPDARLASRQAEQVMRNLFRRMVIRQERAQLRCGTAELVCFVVAQLLDNNGRRPAQHIERVRREPVLFRDPKSRRAVTRTHIPGTVAASRTRSITVNRSSAPKKSMHRRTGSAPPLRPVGGGREWCRQTRARDQSQPPLASCARDERDDRARRDCCAKWLKHA